jgi:glutamate-1-semialdehyde 2,1-aminomutase
MAAVEQTNSGILNAYAAKTPGSARLAAQSKELFPSGITHEARYLEPYGIYVERAQGAQKWDVDGNVYVDYFGGHGALLLGHSHRQVLAAIQQAVDRGSHFGANHPHEVAWAEAIRRLMPAAERVRFTSSGTEATHLALRVARAYTARPKLLRFQGHFHGWHDHMAAGFTSHFDGTPTSGVLPAIAENTVLLPAGDADAVRAALAAGDVAAAIIEPTGGTFGRVPVAPTFLMTLRELTAAHGSLLIFDEVVTGFRVAPGGAQGLYGIRPDLTTLAKILAGGLPGGALVGRKDILDLLDHAATAGSGRERISHQGTYNANPLSAAAGAEALKVVATTDACDRANQLGAKLRCQMNEVLGRAALPWAVYGTFSGFHIFVNPKQRPMDRDNFDPLTCPFAELKGIPQRLAHRLRLAMLINGVDITGWPGGLISCAHTADDVAATAAAFAEAIRMMRQDGEI